MKETIYICPIGAYKNSLSSKIAKELEGDGYNVVMITNSITNFANRELMPQLGESVRGKQVFLVADGDEDPVREAYKVVLTVDALRRASAGKIHLIIPYYYFCRQDKKKGLRVPISASVFARQLEQAGMSHLITVHLHNPAIEGYFEKPTDPIVVPNLFFRKFVKEIETLDGEFNPEKCAVVYADAGGASECEDFAKNSGISNMAGAFKFRSKPNEIEKMIFVGNVEGLNCLVYEDQIDTGGTASKLAGLIMENGANRVFIAGTHPVLSNQAPSKLQSSAYSKVWVTDSLYIPEDKFFAKLEVLSIANVLSATIKNVVENNSISLNDWKIEKKVFA